MARILNKPTSKAAPKSGAAKPFTNGKAKVGAITRVRRDGEISESDLLELVPVGLATTVVNARLHDKRVSVAGLEAPGDYEGAWPELPDDIGKVTHEDLSNLMVRFQAALNTAHWQHTKAWIEGTVFGDVADFLEENAVLASDQSNEQKRKAEARTDGGVLAARALEANSRHDARRFGSMVEQLKGNVAVISRVGGFKDDADESEDTTPSKPASAQGTSKGTSKGATKSRILKR